MHKDQIIYLNSVFDIYRELGLTVSEDQGFVINNLKDLITTFPFNSKVYRANYYSFLFIKDGTGSYTMDDKVFNYGSYTVYFANPGHIKSHTFIDLKEAFRIAVTEEFLKTNIHPDIFEEFSFLMAEVVPPHTLSEQDYSQLETLYTQMLQEYQGVSPYKYRILGKLLAIILLKVKEMFWKNYYPIEEGTRSSEIVKTFKHNLEQHFLELAKGKIETLYQVSDYASAQNLNTNYFNQVIKSKTGKSVSTWITESTLTQAKALLKQSTRSIKEITYLLGYAETAHFSNFFKKHTGISPSSYRKRSW